METIKCNNDYINSGGNMEAIVLKVQTRDYDGAAAYLQFYSNSGVYKSLSKYLRKIRELSELPSDHGQRQRRHAMLIKFDREK